MQLSEGDNQSNTILSQDNNSTFSFCESVARSPRFNIILLINQ